MPLPYEFDLDIVLVHDGHCLNQGLCDLKVTLHDVCGGHSLQVRDQQKDIKGSQNLKSPMVVKQHSSHQPLKPFTLL